MENVYTNLGYLKKLICFFFFDFSVTDSLLATRGYSTPPVSAPYLPVSSLDLVAKNFQAAAAAAQFSQVSIASICTTGRSLSLH